VRHGDVLVFATDGLWDNLAPADVLRLVSRYMVGFDGWQPGADGLGVSSNLRDLTTEGGMTKGRENTIQALLAVAITGEAKMASVNTKVNGPFAREVHRFYPNEDYNGGKVDDICVVVAVVVGEEGD
jgi:protein phosphatase PTC7